jgi:hypothetical protein
MRHSENCGVLLKTLAVLYFEDDNAREQLGSFMKRYVDTLIGIDVDDIIGQP